MVQFFAFCTMQLTGSSSMSCTLVFHLKIIKVKTASWKYKCKVVTMKLHRKSWTIYISRSHFILLQNQSCPNLVMAVITRQGYTIIFVIPTPLLLLLLSSSDDALQSLSHSLSLFPLLSESFSTMVTSESAFTPACKNILGIYHLIKKKHVVISYCSEVFSNARSLLQFQQKKCSALRAASNCQHKVISR